jgi:hypothetical protein
MNNRIFEVLWTVDAVRLLESYYCIHFKVDKTNWGSFSLKKEKGNTHSGKPGNCWKNPEIRVFLENYHP